MKESQFYILPDQIAHFELVQPARCVYQQEITPNYSSQAIVEALKYRYPLNYLGKACQKLLVQCIPALELSICTEEHHNQVMLPYLIKTTKETALKGFLSGRRSALFLHQGKIYRYKGCGNDGDGFILDSNQLRGSHYFHTAKRELFMTRVINDLLEKEIGEKSANVPIFFYEFPKDIQTLGLKNQVSLLSKYCCVFETWGDRRAGTHLISPLEIIFLNLFDSSSFDLDGFFKEKQRADNFGLTELLIDFEMMVEKGQKFLEVFDGRQEFSNYVSLSELRKQIEIKQVQNVQGIAQRLGKKFSSKNSKRIAQLLGQNTNWITYIEIILEKLGWQMGQIKRIFCQHGINWGFFNDHNTWHCNAHLNNFIFTQPVPNKRLSRPLDFDLAFTKQHHINIDIQSESYGKRSDDNFQVFLMAEYNAMEMSVSGVEIMNFKYSIDEEEKEPPLLAKMARIVFRDTLVRAFRWGMRNNQAQYSRICQNWDKNISTIHPLINACLLLSTDFQT